MQIRKNKSEFLNCNLAGFGHTEGYAALNEMHVGDKLIMVREDENKYDKKAIALFYIPKNKLPQSTELTTLEDGTEALHIGYIPATQNTYLANFIDFGYADIFECLITSIDPDEHPNEQIQIRVNLLRKIEKHRKQTK